MSGDRTLDAVNQFLHVVLEQQTVSVADIQKALDTLISAYHETPDGSPAGHTRAPPQAEYAEVYKSLQKRLPDLGYYSAVNPLPVSQDAPLIGDAIDDLADIVLDLQEVLWRFENTSGEDARWAFRSLHDVHWGTHVRHLSLYVHAHLNSDQRVPAD